MNPRNHRTPFTAQGLFIRSAKGYPVAACETEGLAHYLTVSGNFFDRLTAAVRVCRGEYENWPDAEKYPGYWAVIELIDEYERALRG